MKRLRIAAANALAVIALTMVAVVLAVSCAPAPAQAQNLTPERRARMCQDLSEMAEKGDRHANSIWVRHCTPDKFPAPAPAVEVDGLTLARAKNCNALLKKAVGGDPVARYDYAKAREAGLCKT